MTLQTIADAVGVSRMTVSNAFSRPDQLSSDLRATILDKAAELGYAGPDPTARSLARGRAGTVGVLLTDTVTLAFDDEPTAGFVGAIAAELAPTGSAITLLTSLADGDFIPARDVALDGAVVFSCSEDTAAVEWLVKRRLPLVFVDHRPLSDHDSVNIADRDGARLAAQHLIDLGHRHIAIAISSYGDGFGVSGDPLSTTNQVSHQRLLGWFDAIDAAGLDTTVVELPKHVESAAAGVFESVLDLAPRPTAVVCISDVVALAIMRAAKDRGYRIPDDLSVVGFDGTQMAAFANPSLTTIRQDVAAKGRSAAATLVRRMDGSIDEPVRIVLPVELIVGGSTAPPPSN